MDNSSFKTCNEFDGFVECEEWMRAHGSILITDKSTRDMQLNAKVICSVLIRDFNKFKIIEKLLLLFFYSI